MSDRNAQLVIKSNSVGELLRSHNEMTLNSEVQSEPKLKRTFTLPRNPFNTTRMSKRRPKTKDNNNMETAEIKNAVTTNEADTKNNKKVFRRPSIRKFINKIAQHISGVPGINQNITDNNRVPPIEYQTWGPNDTPGVTGLKNHGNTCFINAVLQCITHTDVLAEYFVLDRYKIDLSRRNKLNSKKFGTKGEVTEQLATLLKALWACQYSSELSSSFKQVVERHGSQYKGTQQHDALEFLQWLLDKVHEDLNTASKKKYKSIKTSGRPDEVIAAETLENYKRCNNSFIQGVFQAQYRSSLSCSRCRTQSNTFDPFQCISVQLPQFHKQSIYVTVLYTSQQPRQVQIGLSIPSGATVSELRGVLESDTSIQRANMLLTEIGEGSFLRTFTDTQSVNVITEIDPIYCIEVAQLKDVEEDSTSAYVLLCWINVVKSESGGECQRFGSPYTMQISRETSYDDLQKLLLKEMAPILHDDILTSSQPRGIFRIRISDPACNDNEPPCYLDPELEHPLFMEAIDQALALCSEEGGPPHVKLILEWPADVKSNVIADDEDLVDEHSSVKVLRMQALQGAPLTLEECLRDYTEAETLTDAWRCPHCQQYQPVVKTLDVWSLPDILIVHFKRFRQQGHRPGNSTKLTTMVDFPVYGFDMSPHLANKRNASLNRNVNLSDSDNTVILGNGWSPWKRARKQSHSGDNMYDLYAVCYHHGTDLETGHYTAACKNTYDQQWYLYDDAKVTNLSDDDISSVLVNNSAYILFYQKRCGQYVGSSSNSSSAASTSSVGSSNEHWIARMPKFVPPKISKTNNSVDGNNKKQIITNGSGGGGEEKTVSPNQEEELVPKETNESVKKDLVHEDKVALRNSQNTLYSGGSNNSIRKSLETKPILISDGGGTNEIKKSPSLSVPKPVTPEEQIKKPVYTTSIYINSSGNVDISTTTSSSMVPPTSNSLICSTSSSSNRSNNCDKSPVLSLHRVKGVEEEDLEGVEVRSEGGREGEKVYTTTASVHRYSSSLVDKMATAGYRRGDLVNVSRTQLNWMSPQPTRKICQAQQSM